jgi:sporulation protein YlmC with PRC-barrel domain
MQPVETYISVKRQNIPLNDLALRRGARVEATDGPVGLVDELLINSNNNQVTHLVLLERHIWTKREITIPVSQIDRVYEDVVYLKLDRQSVEQLPTTYTTLVAECKKFRLKRR